MASDSTHFRAWDQNIFTEWHSRYRHGKRGVLIYWTVERGGAMAVHSQLLACSASEVHAMIEGAMRHGTDMTIESNYVDSHGQSLVPFTWARFCRTCAPTGTLMDIECTHCGNGPLVLLDEALPGMPADERARDRSIAFLREAGWHNDDDGMRCPNCALDGTCTETPGAHLTT